MKRSLKSLASLDAVRHLAYVPVIVARIENWVRFLMNYVGLEDSPNTYRFRNGVRVKALEAVDASSIAVIFIKEDYGPVADNAVVIDIGANIGAYSVYAATAARGTRVYSFEPLPDSYDVLVENIGINGLADRVFAFRLGVASKRETRSLYFGDASPFHSLYSAGGDGRRCVEIPCVSLSDILEDNRIDACDLLKIDCEGAEYEILYNTPASCFGKIREIRMEYHNRPDRDPRFQIGSLRAFLLGNGFEAVKVREDSGYSGIAWFVRSRASTALRGE